MLFNNFFLITCIFLVWVFIRKCFSDITVNGFTYLETISKNEESNIYRSISLTNRKNRNLKMVCCAVCGTADECIGVDVCEGGICRMWNGLFDKSIATNTSTEMCRWYIKNSRKATVNWSTQPSTVSSIGTSSTYYLSTASTIDDVTSTITSFETNFTTQESTISDDVETTGPDESTLTTVDVTTIGPDESTLTTVDVTTIGPDESTLKTVDVTTIGPDESSLTTSDVTRTEAGESTLTTVYVTTTESDESTLTTVDVTTTEPDESTLTTLDVETTASDESTITTVDMETTTSEESTLTTVDVTTTELDESTLTTVDVETTASDESTITTVDVTTTGDESTLTTVDVTTTKPDESTLTTVDVTTTKPDESTVTNFDVTTTEPDESTLTTFDVTTTKPDESTVTTVDVTTNEPDESTLTTFDVTTTKPDESTVTTFDVTTTEPDESTLTTGDGHEAITTGPDVLHSTIGNSQTDYTTPATDGSLATNEAAMTTGAFGLSSTIDESSSVDDLTTITDDVTSTTSPIVTSSTMNETSALPDTIAVMPFEFSNRTIKDVVVYNESDFLWIVIQRRFDGSVDFYRNWTDYETGFGSIQSEFWLGNQYIYELTGYGYTILRIELTSFDGEVRQIEYDFSIENKTNNYRLHISELSASGIDSLARSDLAFFCTFDKDNDGWQSTNCADWSEKASGWWHAKRSWCTDGNLNGIYRNVYTNDDRGINWFEWDSHFTLKETQMMLRKP